uniref:Reverse transcriptase domain-containing protein n=1 Tax=Caenorhabditis japonica TaxID=281687 RepID=A0A8R1HTK3_CAEJA
MLARRHSTAVIKLQKTKLKVWRREGNSPCYKELSTKLKNLLHKEDLDFNEIHLNKSSPKAFFNFINSRYKNDQEIGILKDAKNTQVTSDYMKAELLSNCFSNAFTEDKSTNTDFPYRTNHFINSLCFEPFIVESILSKLTPKCNTTPDGIPAIFLKRTCTSIALPLSIIFRNSYNQAVLPSFWKTALVKPLHKKGSRSDPNNYRPISLTSAVGKVMEKMVRKSIILFLDDFKLLSNSQYGFRSKMGTESQLLSYQNKLVTNYLSKQTTFSVYIDFRKAFDTVGTKKLLIKLERYGIRNHLLRWLENFLSNRTQRVIINGVMSEEKSVLSGVPQGSVLGPLLFLLFVNDIGDNFNSDYLLYADDLKIFSTDKSSIQRDLDSLSTWCENWQMSVAPNKCETIAFYHSKRGMDKDTKFTIGGATVPITSRIRDLGMFFTSDLSFSNHIDTVLRKAHQRVNIFFNVLRHAGFDTFIKCFIIYMFQEIPH